jgi:hypothetical protein
VNRAISDIMQSPEGLASGREIPHAARRHGAEFDAMLKSDIRNWGAAVRRLGIKVN